jgi:hypothetical protein
MDKHLKTEPTVELKHKHFEESSVDAIAQQNVLLLHESKRLFENSLFVVFSKETSFVMLFTCEYDVFTFMLCK